MSTQQNSGSFLSFFHVDKIYPPKQTALRNVDFRIGQGEFVFVAGASGAGKTTLLRLLFAQERASRGQVVVAGNNLHTLTSEKRARYRRNLGVIFQDYKLLPTRTVLENVALALEVIGIRRKERMERARGILTAVGLSERLDHFPPMLSGGEQQRVAIARALVTKPRLILADEPTGNLDPDMTVAIFNLLLEANECGATVLIASHNLSLIEEINQRTIVLDKGQLIGDFAHPRGM